MLFWQFFREGQLVGPSRIPCWISKTHCVLGSYELLAILGGKVIKGSSVQYGKKTVWGTLRLKRPQLPSKYTAEKTLHCIWLNMYSDWIKGFYGFILSLPFILLFICCTSILCRYKSKNSKIINLKTDQSFSNNFV